MKVLVIFTGGTIGSKTENNIIDVKNNSYYIIEKYTQKYGDTVQFDTIQPINQLSENFTLKTLETLGNTILKVDTSKYDGIIVTHGSDTLCYTSAFLGMITRHFNIPIVMVASNYELDNSKANGLNNFHGAVLLIKSKLLRGCFVVWKDSITNELNIHLSTRLRECDSFTDNFKSYGDECFGSIQNGKVVLNDNEINPTIEEINVKRSPLCDEIHLENKCMLIKTYTGLNFSNFNTKNISSILVYLYHSGTACTLEEDTSILRFISQNSDKNIYIASLKNVDEHYSTTNDILKSGVISMYNISIESAYIKSLIISNLDLNTNISSKENLFFESIC